MYKWISDTAEDRSKVKSWAQQGITQKTNGKRLSKNSTCFLRCLRIQYDRLTHSQELDACSWPVFSSRERLLSSRPAVIGRKAQSPSLAGSLLAVLELVGSCPCVRAQPSYRHVTAHPSFIVLAVLSSSKEENAVSNLSPRSRLRTTGHLLSCAREIPTLTHNDHPRRQRGNTLSIVKMPLIKKLHGVSGVNRNRLYVSHEQRSCMTSMRPGRQLEFGLNSNPQLREPTRRGGRNSATPELVGSQLEPVTERVGN